MKALPTHTQTNQFDRQSLQFLLDEAHSPMIQYESRYYHSFNELINTFPHPLTDDLKLFAEMANFMFKGDEFSVIDDIEAFKKAYHTQIQREKTRFIVAEQRLSEYGIFDLSSLHSPRLEAQQFIFFVKNDFNQLPYKVTCTLSSHEQTSHVHYTLLPYL